MFFNAKLLLITYLLGQAIASVDPLRSSVSVKIRNGTVVGVNDERNQVQRFLGIPYAQPPVGDLRLRHAIPLNTSFNTFHAQSFGSACYGPEIDSNPDSSEGCLTLNIWRPAGQNKADALKPVMVWFYGGGLRAGYTVRAAILPENLIEQSRQIPGSKEPILFAYLPKSTKRFCSFQWCVRSKGRVRR